VIKGLNGRLITFAEISSHTGYKEESTFIEARINELSDLVARAQIIDPSALEHKTVSFGSTVQLLDIDSEDEVEYTIVGATESNPDRGLISFHSPLAKQMIGKRGGDEFIAKLPSGEKEFEVLKVYYKPIVFS